MRTLLTATALLLLIIFPMLQVPPAVAATLTCAKGQVSAPAVLGDHRRP